MNIPRKVPYLSYEQIGEISYDFLSEHGLEKQIPINIESILEFDLGMGIIPIPGFQQNHSVEGSLSIDTKTIYVDEYVFRAVETRYRFTLAHELGHLLLHKEFFEGTGVSTILDWKRAYRAISENSYFELEMQAYNFAGHILVPSPHLRSRFTDFVSDNKSKFVEARRKGVVREITLSFFKNNSIYRLSKLFNVSPEVMEKRIDKDNLMALIP